MINLQCVASLSLFLTLFGSFAIKGGSNVN